MLSVWVDSFSWGLMAFLLCLDYSLDEDYNEGAVLEIRDFKWSYLGESDTNLALLKGTMCKFCANTS